MYFDDDEGMVFRPPSEANSFILRVTIGCAHNKCTFCGMYRDVIFRAKPFSAIKLQIELAARSAPQLRRVFLADGNALCLSTEFLQRILQELHQTFPKLTRVTCYGGPNDILRKSPQELLTLKEAGLHMIYLGIESGDDEVLTAVCKGIDGAGMIEAGRKVLGAGIKLSAMVILGLGGKTRTIEHANNTAAVVNAINPTMLSALTLMLHGGTPLREAADKKEFLPLSPYELVLELYQLVNQLKLSLPCIFRANHASNLLPLSGTLPADKERLLADIRYALQFLRNETVPTYNDHGNF